MQVILVIWDDSSNLENAGQIINHVNLRFEQIVVIAALSGLQIYLCTFVRLHRRPSDLINTAATCRFKANSNYHAEFFVNGNRSRLLKIQRKMSFCSIRILMMNGFSFG